MKQFDFKTRHGIIKVYEDPNMSSDQALVLPYKNSSRIEAGAFYAPYVPLQRQGMGRALRKITGAGFYWQATGLYENRCPCEVSNVSKTGYYQWGAFVQIDGHFTFRTYEPIHETIQAWARQCGAKLLIDEEFPDIILFYSMDDAVLFRIAFGEQQPIS